MITNPDSELGEFCAEYKSTYSKIIINVILALVWIFLGFALASLIKAQITAFVVGALFIGSGIAYVVIPYLNRVGLTARLYTEGLWVKARGKQQAWRFEDVDGLRLLCGEKQRLSKEFVEQGIPKIFGLLGGIALGLAKKTTAASIPPKPKNDIQGYRFFVADTRAFNIGPQYKNWRELGASVYNKVLPMLIEHWLEQLDRGEHFTSKLNGQFNMIDLTLSTAGVQEQGKALIPWGEITWVNQNEIRGFAVIKTKAPGQSITFAVEGGKNTLVIVGVIKAIIQRARYGEKSSPPDSMKTS